MISLLDVESVAIVEITLMLVLVQGVQGCVFVCAYAICAGEKGAHSKNLPTHTHTHVNVWMLDREEGRKEPPNKEIK